MVVKAPAYLRCWRDLKRLTKDLIIRNSCRKDSGLYIGMDDNDHHTSSAATYIRADCKDNFVSVELEKMKPCGVRENETLWS